MAYRRRRFGSGPRTQRPAIKETTQPCPYAKGQACSGCSTRIQLGEPSVRFMLSKRYRIPCTACGNEPRRSRWYHERCRPADVNKAMGFDPTHVNPHVHAPRPTAAPPPKPKSAMDITLESVVMLEAALIAQVRERKRPMTPELEKQFETFKGIKGHIVRPSNDNEQQNAMIQGLIRLIKMALT